MRDFVKRNLARYKAPRDVRFIDELPRNSTGSPALPTGDPSAWTRSSTSDTSPLPDGIALIDVQPPEMRERQRREAQERGDGWRWPAPDRETLLSGAFGGASGLQEHDLDLIEQRATPQPYATFTSPVRLNHDSPPGVRRAAIFCAAGGVSVELVRGLLAQGDPRAAVFAGPGWELHELPTGHWPMFSEPALLSELLARIASGPGG